MEVKEWDKLWVTNMKVWRGENSNFSRDCGSYFVDETVDENVLKNEKNKFQWYGTPVGFMRHEELGKMDEKSQKQWYKLYYENLSRCVLTKRDYDAVENHSFLMHYGGQKRGEEIYRCDFSGLSRGIVQYFLLQLSQKKFLTESDKEKEVPYYPRVVLSEMGQFRAVVVKKLEQTELKKSQDYLEKNNTMTYNDDQSVKSYFDRTALGRLNDATMLMTNIDESSLIIPGDGYGVFTKVAQLTGKEVVSGEISRKIVNLAKSLGVELECEEGEKSIERGIEKFGLDCLILVSFLWSVAPKILEYISRKQYRVLVYDKFIYYKGSSDHVEYGSRVVRGVRGINWRGVPIKMSEEVNYHIDKPLLTEIVKGVLWFDSIKGIRQIAMYSEMYPNKLKVSKSSKVSRVELREMSLIHKFSLVEEEEEPKVWLVRCPHNAGKGLSYDIDLWRLISDPINVNKMIIGSVPTSYTTKLFSRDLVSKGSGKANSHRKVAKKNVCAPRQHLDEIVSLQNMRFEKLKKYYLKSGARLTPSVRPIYDDGIVQLVWLRGGTYLYEEGDSQTKYINFTLTS